MVDALIDTGFTGFLCLPQSTITTLGLPWHFRDVGTLGDGSEAIFEMYKATVIWDGQIQVIDVASSETEPLVGMSLLYGFKVQIEAVAIVFAIYFACKFCAPNELSRFPLSRQINCRAMAKARQINLSLGEDKVKATIFLAISYLMRSVS
jgi:clan AA aspartic protease